MMRALAVSTIAAVFAFGSVAQAAPSKQLSPSAKMNKLIANVCTVELGNGAYAFRSYDPAKYRRQDMKKQIAQDMRGFESKGVTFRTYCGAAKVKSKLRELLGYPESNATRLCQAIDGFQKLGVLQDVVYRGLVGGPAVGDTYFSIPHQVFFCLKTPTQKGKRVEVFMELGD